MMVMDAAMQRREGLKDVMSGMHALKIASPPSITSLPLELLTQILHHLPPSTLLQTSLTKPLYESSLRALHHTPTITSTNLHAYIATLGKTLKYIKNLTLDTDEDVLQAFKGGRMEKVVLSGLCADAVEIVIGNGLRELNVAFTGVTRVRSSSLRVLRAAGTALTEIECPKLRVADVSGCLPQVVGMLEGCRELVEVNMMGVKGMSVNALEMLCRVRDLKMGNVEWVESPFPPPSIPLTPLRILDLSNANTALPLALLIALLSSSKQLKILTVSGITHLTDAVASVIGRVGGGLEFLGMAYCRRVGDEGVLSVARGCGRLRGLDISGLSVRDKTLHAITTFCPRLRRLHLSKCPNLTDSSFLSLPTLPHLTRLHLSHSPHLSLHLFRVLISRCAFRRLAITGCRGVLDHCNVSEYTAEDGKCVLDEVGVERVRRVLGIPWIVERGKGRATSVPCGRREGMDMLRRQGSLSAFKVVVAKTKEPGM